MILANQSNKREDLKTIYREKKDMFGLAYEFNMLPARYIHRSWIESYIPFNIFKSVAKSERGAEKLSNLILAHYKLNYEFYYEFYDPSLRFALLPSEIISKLALYSGIALNYKFITKAIDKQKKTKIIESIGQHGYRFAVTHAPLLVGEIKIDINLQPTRDDYKGFVEKCGAIYFLSSLAHAPRSLISRFFDN
jgi:hypothetical protein